MFDFSKALKTAFDFGKDFLLGGSTGGYQDPFRLFISNEECDWASQISHLWALDLFWLKVMRV